MFRVLAARTQRALQHHELTALIDRCTGPAQSVDRLAESLALSARRIGARLALLRRHGVAHRVTLYDPTRLGRPFQALTYVTFRHGDARARAEFERRCQEDREITTAVLITGAYDYALTTFHRDEQVARRWLAVLRTVDGVSRADLSPLQTRFGHTIKGAPVFWSSALDPRSRRHGVA
ncbi:Lrp/AsnC family transcriptional regulator [Caulobacter sp. KR2-114]|uniref:Lrp/AsnC family transcriptional regulator n=1 Tax=Caulobacter sp. KR2-114 TaxID=3400912 RepID=UPI003BFD539C